MEEQEYNMDPPSPEDLRAVYGVPIFLASERDHYFYLNPQDMKFMRSLGKIEDAVYFIISLAYFRKKKTLVDFGYQDSTYDRRYVIQRYFPNQSSPRTLPNSGATTKIENKVLRSTGYSRINADSSRDIQKQLDQVAQLHPKQRQLFQALLDIIITNCIAIPGYRSMQNFISNAWNKQVNRLSRIYYRYTNKPQREAICSLMEKSGRSHQIISIRKDMKNFNTTELTKEIDKHQKLKPIFTAALEVIPRFNLPDSTLEYYASLIHYYGGWKLKYINRDYAQIYLLCYCYMRYQAINDNLVEAFKKRVHDYERLGKDYVQEQALTHQDNLKDISNKLSALLFTIHKYAESNTDIPLTAVYKHIAKADLLATAKQLADEPFDKQEAYWQFIEKESRSIHLNLRPLFLEIDFSFTNNQRLEDIVGEIKSRMNDCQFNHKNILPKFIEHWIPIRYKEYISPDDSISLPRLEFLLYRQLAYRIEANDVSMQYSFQYKHLEDELTPKKIWNKSGKKLLKSLGYPRLLTPIRIILKELREESIDLYRAINQRIDHDENPGIKIYDEQDLKSWRMRPLKAETEEYGNSLFSEFQALGIVDVICLVDHLTHFSRAFEPVEPRGHKGKREPRTIMAVVLANAIRIGVQKMAESSDLNLSALLSAESDYVRVETLRAAADIINNASSKLPIFKEWNINEVLHGSMDGTKIETVLEHIKARNSQKYFHDGVGVSSFNMVANSLPLGAILIGSNEYEGHFAFELFQHGNTSDIKPVRQSGDGHSINQLNFALFYMIEKVFMPRIPKLHRETLYGFGDISDYQGHLILPNRITDESLIVDEWDNIQRIYHTLITGSTRPSVIIRKLAARSNSSRTKKAFWEFNNIIKSIHVLRCIDDEKIRRGINKALNRGEAYNKLGRAIGLNKGGRLKGYNERDLEIWNECTRLIASIITYYNTYILSKLFSKANKQEREMLINSSPLAWTHIMLLGFYQFYNDGDVNLDKLIRDWDWKKAAGFC